MVCAPYNNALLTSKIDELFQLVYSRAYKTTMEGLRFSVPKSQHKLSYIIDAVVYKPTGERVRTVIKSM